MRIIGTGLTAWLDFEPLQTFMPRLKCEHSIHWSKYERTRVLKQVLSYSWMTMLYHMIETKPN